MPKPPQSGSTCTGRCRFIPNGHQPSPLVADLLICRFCKQVTKKGAPLPGSKADEPGKTHSWEQANTLPMGRRVSQQRRHGPVQALTPGGADEAVAAHLWSLLPKRSGSGGLRVLRLGQVLHPPLALHFRFKTEQRPHQAQGQDQPPPGRS